jgi:hypothetical protein
MNNYNDGVFKTPGMESTPAKRTTDSSIVSQKYAILGTSAAQLDDICSMYKDRAWGDIMIGYNSRPTTPPNTVTRPVISHDEILFLYYIDLVTDPYKYGDELDKEMATVEAELRELGKWPDVISYLIYLEEEKMRIEEDRAAKLEKFMESEKIMDEKRQKHKLKIVGMQEAARQQVANDKARAAAKLAARQVATVKDGEACKYYRDNGIPEPAREGWEAGCGYHKEGKCTHVHPDEPGWEAAVAKRKIARSGHRHGHYNNAPRSGGFRSGSTRW